MGSYMARFLAVLGKSYVVLAIECRLVVCKVASAFTDVLAL